MNATTRRTAEYQTSDEWLALARGWLRHAKKGRKLFGVYNTDNARRYMRLYRIASATGCAIDLYGRPQSIKQTE